MKIAGIQKNSFVDFPGRIAAVVFTPGCNMDCYYCHNRDILCGGGQRILIDPAQVIQMLSERRKFLDGVVVSGGEPTLQAGLEEFIAAVKGLGYAVKLDTNGTNPHLLRKLMNLQLLDYIAMDIKAPLKRYSEICGVCVDTGAVKDSMSLLMEGGVNYEFRTTVIPELHREDILEMAQMVKGARLYVLQQFRRPPSSGAATDYRLSKMPHDDASICEMSDSIKHLVKQYDTRGIA